MPTTIELPSQRMQTVFNLRRWDEVLSDEQLAKIEGRVETDRHGYLIMSPPPSARHGRFEFRIGHLLQQLLPEGEVITECPISTADGVKATDVAWASAENIDELGNRACFARAPEICVEVLSPRNSDAEIKEKRTLYFDAGAKEVWICSGAGKMTFYRSESARPMRASILCPSFPKEISLG